MWTKTASRPERRALTKAPTPANRCGRWRCIRKLNLLYMGGWGDAAISVYKLNDAGEPQGEPLHFPVGGQGKIKLAVSADGKHLYIGTYPDTLEVLDLDDNGFPVGAARSFVAGSEGWYLKFELGDHALYMSRTTPQGPRLGVWKLNGNGDPDGAIQLQETPATALAVDNARSRLWVGANATFADAFNGETKTEGTTISSFSIGPDGSLQLLARGATLARQKSTLLALSPSGQAAGFDRTRRRRVAWQLRQRLQTARHDFGSPSRRQEYSGGAQQRIHHQQQNAAPGRLANRQDERVARPQRCLERPKRSTPGRDDEQSAACQTQSENRNRARRRRCASGAQGR